MPSAVITQTVDEPLLADLKALVITGDFTSGAGINVQVQLSLKNTSDGENRLMTFVLNASAGQKNSFQSDVDSAMSTVIADVEAILGVTFA